MVDRDVFWPFLKSAKRLDWGAWARLVELVDTADLKSADPRSCQFESGSGHHNFFLVGFYNYYFLPQARHIIGWVWVFAFKEVH